MLAGVERRGMVSAEMPMTAAPAPVRAFPRGARAAFRMRVVGPLVTGIAYYVGARIGFVLQSPDVPQSLFWLPNSILLTALLVVPVRTWPAYLIASFPAQMLVAWQGGEPMLTMSLLFLTNCLDAAVGASLVRALVGGPWRPDTLRNTLIFLVFAAILAPMVVSFADAAITVMTGWGQDYWTAATTRIRANVLTNLIVAPAAATAIAHIREWPRPVSRQRVAEAALLVTGLLIITIAVFTSHPDAAGLPSLFYIPLSLLLWAAVRFGPGLTGGALFVVTLVSSWYVTHGDGAARDPASVIAMVQLQLLAISIPLMCLAAVVQERVRVEQMARAREKDVRSQFAQLSAIYRTAPVGLAFVDRELRFVSVNDQMAEINGAPAAAHIGRRMAEVVPGFAAEVEPLIRRVMSTGAALLHREMRGSTSAEPGVERDWVASYHPVRDDDGTVLGVTIVFREITEHKRSEATLRESQAALRASYDRIRDMAGELITAQERERSRLARELHDDVNQQLAAMSIALSGLKRRLPADALDAREEVARFQRRTLVLVEGVRRLSRELHPGLLQHAGLVAALRSICGELGRPDFTVTLRAPDQIGPLPDEIALGAYRVAQEALHNITSHSKARNVVVELARDARELTLIVTDDGIGFDVGEARRAGGLGLISIDERVRLLKGSVVIQSRPKQGTELRVRIPLGEDLGSTESIAR
jgi:PAS domain S-box-containing protein